MKSFPMVLVREFNGRETSYRVAARRSRNYWEFLANIHNVFGKPWERYNAHLHFDGHACDDRVSPSEWDAGGYFDAEFVVDGRIVLYAHFEEVEPPSESSMNAHRHLETEQEDRLWYQGTYGDQGLLTKRKFTEDIEDILEEPNQNPYPPFPEELPSNPLVAEPVLEPTYTFKSALALPVATSGVVTIDDSSSRSHLDNGVVIGRALPQSCLDPNVRPVVRAIINRVGVIVAYIPGRYSKRSAIKGDIQIAMTHVEYIPELTEYPFGEERSRAIKSMIEERNGPEKTNATPDSRLSIITPPLPIVFEGNIQEVPIITTEDSKYPGLCKEGIIIGHAKEHWCLNPHKRPTVRARLSKKDSVIAFVPAKDTKHARTCGEVQIPLNQVDFSEWLTALPPWKVSDAVRTKIKTKEANGSSAIPDSCGHMGGRAVKKGGKVTAQALDIAGNAGQVDSLSDNTEVPEAGVLH